jgi:hypothetical protein
MRKRVARAPRCESHAALCAAASCAGAIEVTASASDAELELMSAKAPPVPPANRSPKGPGGSPDASVDTSHGNSVPENLKEQDRQGNIAQNTTNQGYQQDR